MNEAKLIEKLFSIEAIFARSTFEGERVAAERAKQRILERLAQFEQEDPPVEFKFSMTDMWARKVFVALLRRYGITPYRYSGQRYTTVMARLSKRFVDETLWPEFLEVSEVLRGYLAEVTDRVVEQVFHSDSSEAAVVQEPRQLTFARDGMDSSPPVETGAQHAEQAGGGRLEGVPAGNPAGNRSKRKNKKNKKRKRK